MFRLVMSRLVACRRAENVLYLFRDAPICQGAGPARKNRQSAMDEYRQRKIIHVDMDGAP